MIHVLEFQDTIIQCYSSGNNRVIVSTWGFGWWSVRRNRFNLRAFRPSDSIYGILCEKGKVPD